MRIPAVPCSPAVAILGAMILAAVSLGTTVARASAPAMPELLRQLRSQERALRNLTAAGEWWEELSSKDGAGGWTRGKEYESAVGWYDGLAGGPSRVDVRYHLSRWVNGAAPYYEASYTWAFDGRTGKFISYKAGSLGKMAKLPTASLFPAAPAALAAEGMATGTSYSIFFYGGARTFSATMEQNLRALAGHPEVPVNVTEEKFGRADTIRITSGTPEKVQESWWLDRDRDLAFLGYRDDARLRDGSTICYREVRVTSLLQAAPSIWYPAEAFCYDRWFPSGADRYVGPAAPDSPAPAGPRRRLHFLAGTIVANDPKFDAKVFSPSVPPGYLVTDRIHNSSYRTAPGPGELDKELEKLLKDTKSTTQAAGPPMGSPDGQASDSQSEPQLAEDSAGAGRHMGLFGGLVFLVLGIALAGVGLRRRGRRSA